MKKLVVALMLVSMSLVSCGKNNATNSGATSGISNPITTTVSGASSLGSLIDNYSSGFGTGQIMYYGNPQAWGTLANTGLNLGYRYTKSTSSASSSNCSLKWGIFYVCTSSSSTSTSSVTESRKVSNNSVDILAKQNELKGYINNAISISVSGTSYMIYCKDGKKYALDTRYPLQAQPTGIMDSTGTEYLYNITEN